MYAWPPRVADVLLREDQLGDLLRVIAIVIQPDDPDAPARLTVVDALKAAPAPVMYDLVLELPCRGQRVEQCRV
ncbi:MULTISPECIES: hypothetical protein [unclassified Streptomyces]|uniref:hypothetical protein n=1 Tax=unclassified Streptomyces TaxID=2593676 RepID=UPI002F90D353